MILLRIQKNLENFLKIVVWSAHRFYWDDCFSRASALAYATLFALVPMISLTFSVFSRFGSAFGLGDEQLLKLIHYILEQILPPTENLLLKTLKTELFDYLQLFAQNVRDLNIFSLAILFFSAIALFFTIESALNVIWRVTAELTILSKIVNFWFVITGGPLLVALSFFWYSKFEAAASGSYASNLLNGVFGGFIYLVVPVFLTWLGLSVMYMKLPAAKVSFNSAALGALFSAILFEFVKRFFAYYISLSATYSTIYGVLTSVPLFLFWLYLTWCVILLGAELSYLAGSFHILSGLRRYSSDLGEVGSILGLRIVVAISKTFEKGLPPLSEGDIAIETGAEPVRVRNCLELLTEARILTQVDHASHSRTLMIPTKILTVGRIIESFNSKEHLKKLKISESDKGMEIEPSFLEQLRRTSLSLGQDRSIETWTLQEITSVKLTK